MMELIKTAGVGKNYELAMSGYFSVTEIHPHNQGK
jgi:hypothetical protein